MPDSPKFALATFAVYAVVLYNVNSFLWKFVFVGFVVFRLLRTDFGKRALATLPRDLAGLKLLISVKSTIRRLFKRDRPIHEIFLDQVKAQPDKLAVIEVETGRQLTYRELNELANQYANLYVAEGYKMGDVVALFMENSIDFFAIWLGLSKIGVVSAFINSNLKLEPLAHSINVSKCKSCITNTSLLPMYQAAIEKKLISDDINVFLAGLKTDGRHRSLQQDLHLFNTTEPAPVDGLDFKSVLCYIYTSGTTGNPKPAVIKHFRYFWISMGSGKAFGIRPDDVVYITMPMYHSAAGIMGIGSLISFGTTAVIRKKFSASNFWKDCVKYNVTATQYIGEICRYLLAAKECPEEKQHKVRLMWGNGLRSQIWKEFVGRFGIKRIGELYGSTEGNSNIVNLDNHVGSCGFMPIYPHIGAFYPVRLIRVDRATGELMRDKNGLCVPCVPGETGEMVGVIKEKDALLKFEGYVSDGDTQKKIYRDVFKHGDKVFASGDILHWDELGYLYFVDRCGDTFRWKGENVSTTEVEGILQPVMDVEDATVYGVTVGQMEGRAGMAGIVVKEGTNVEHFLADITKRLTENLATYAIPVFIRLCKEVDRTGTFKLKKTDLQKEGFDLTQCKGDPIYYWSAADKSYQPLTEKMQKDIDSGAYNRI
uniref:long-chain-fatty-acid--CoA ligase n=1 Tax=Caenorhabditis japonica TaxID=281687 RepID=A0A8R1DT80_CAEJA